jgi:hypothetical protein
VQFDNALTKVCAKEKAPLQLFVTLQLLRSRLEINPMQHVTCPAGLRASTLVSATNGTIRRLTLKETNSSELVVVAQQRQLQHLDLSSCRKLTDDAVQHLSSLTVLQYLDLSGCENLTDGAVQHLLSLTALQHLNLSRCRNLTNGAVQHLLSLTALKYLDLSYCGKITRGAVQQLASLTALHHLIV